VKFSRTDKSEIFGVKEKDDILFALVLIEGEILNYLTVNNGTGAKRRSGFSDKN
jgi:hypothetical protein